MMNDETKPSTVGADTRQKPRPGNEVLLLVIPMIATVMIWLELFWYWITKINLLNSPREALFLILLATVMGTAVAAATEASSVGMETDDDKASTGPIFWFIGISLIWVFAYPFYLYQRRQYALRNLAVVGLLNMIVFAGSWVFINAEMKHQQIGMVSALGHVNYEPITFQTAQINKNGPLI